MAQSSGETVTPRTNRLLAMLPDDEYERLAGDLERVYLEPRQPMVQANRPIEVVDFVLYGVGSQLATMRDGTTVEVGPIGRGARPGCRCSSARPRRRSTPSCRFPASRCGSRRRPSARRSRACPRCGAPCSSTPSRRSARWRGGWPATAPT